MNGNIAWTRRLSLSDSGSLNQCALINVWVSRMMVHIENIHTVF